MFIHRKLSRHTITTRRKWADLPRELLEKIGEFLQSRLDVFRYRAVCSSWRSAVPLSRLTSSLTLISSSLSNEDNNYQNSAFMSAVTIFRLEEKYGSGACVVKLVETPEGRFEVLHPLTIPKQDFIFGKTLDFTKFRLFELAQYHYHCDSSIMFGELSIQKAVMFRNCGILAIYDFWKLGFRVPGDEKWTELGHRLARYDDILVYQGEYYVIDRFGLIWWIDKSMNLVKYLPPLSPASMGQTKNLVESEGKLYVVETFYGSQSVVDENGDVIDSRTEKIDMKVFKLDEEWGTWIQVTSLGDQVFVVGKEVCFSVSVNDFPGCQGNCIYFIDSAEFEEEVIGFRNEEEDMVFNCNNDLLMPYCRKMRGSPSLVRYHDVKMGYYSPRVFKLDDRSIRDVEGSPSLKRLFTPPKDCFCSTLSFP